MANPIYFYTEGDIPVIAQPTGMSCWATVNTMLVSWKNQQSYSIESVMDWLSSDFRQIFDSDTGLEGSRNQEWAAINGFSIEYESCETPQHILDLLQNHGPLIIIDDENNGTTNADGNRSWCVHARIIVGIEGEDVDDPASVSLSIIDPNDGQQYMERFTAFEAKYEAMAGASNFQILMVHY